MVRVVFSASGFGRKTYRYPTRQKAMAAIEADIASVAADHGCDLSRDVSCWADEWVLNSSSGEEISRWELFDNS